MPPLLGLNFLKSKKHSSPSDQQQEITEEKASTSRYGVQNPPVIDASKAKMLETHHKISAKASLQTGYGASTSNQEISSTHVNPRKKGSSSTQAPVTRKNFFTVKNVRQDEVFTNNEMLPGMEKAYKQFRRLYPEYHSTRTIDKIRAKEYAYLDEKGHVCLDYSGYGLFSKWQETCQMASSSFGLSYISVNLPTHALYGEADEGTAEYDIKIMVSDFLKIQESEYAMVFTASRGSAFKLLGESYPFHISKKLLSVYDYESDAVKWIGEAAQKRGAEIMSAKFRWPSQRLWATDLKKKIKIEKQRTKKEPAKGLFVFPVQSRVTGANYSYQWMSQAQENGWDILLDASALGPNALGSLGLCVFRPDFIVSSFFKVYGSDPTGFGCLMIKRTVLQRLHTSSAARGVGMVRLVPTSLCPPEGQPKGGGLQEPVYGSLRYTGQRRRSSSTRTLAGSSQQFCMDQAYSSKSKFSLESSGAGSDEIIPSVSYAHSPVLTKLQREKGSEAASSTSERSATQGVESLSSSDSVHGLSLTKPQQKFPSPLEGPVEEVQFSEGDDEGVAEFGQNDECQRESRSNPEEGIVFADVDRASGSETGGRGMLRPNGQQASSSSAMNGHTDSPLNYSKDGISSAVFYNDEEDNKNASLPFYKDDDDDDAKAFDVVRKEDEIVCRGLQHAQELGLIGTNVRLRCLINWLIASMLKLRHPGSQGAHRLVQIYGPKVSYDRGPSVAFNLFDWKENLLQPSLVQRLADRNNISFGITALNHIQVPKSSSHSSKYSEHLNQINVSKGYHGSGNRVHVSESMSGQAAGEATGVGKFPSFEVVTISLCFLSNFQDVYKFWVFLANFLDADFVSKEVWVYRSLNQEMVVMGIEEPSKSSSFS